MKFKIYLLHLVLLEMISFKIFEKVTQKFAVQNNGFNCVLVTRTSGGILFNQHSF